MPDIFASSSFLEPIFITNLKPFEFSFPTLSHTRTFSSPTLPLSVDISSPHVWMTASSLPALATMLHPQISSGNITYRTQDGI